MTLAAMDIYMTVVSNRMNEIMKVLTIFTAFFVPLTFVAGIYGMNFENMPELRSRIGYFVVSILAQIVLGILASTIVMWFSRRREFRADAGGADLAGRHKMISALKALQRQSEPQDLPGEFAAFGISGGLGHGIKQLFLSHPPLEQRIAALQAGR